MYTCVCARTHTQEYYISSGKKRNIQCSREKQNMTLSKKLNGFIREDVTHTRNMFNIRKNTIPTKPLVSGVPDINFYCAMLHIQSAEKLHAQTSWGDRVDQNKDLLSSNCLSEMRPHSATDHQSRSKVGNEVKPLKYSEQKLYFIPI